MDTDKLATSINIINILKCSPGVLLPLQSHRRKCWPHPEPNTHFPTIAAAHSLLHLPCFQNPGARYMVYTFSPPSPTKQPPTWYGSANKSWKAWSKRGTGMFALGQDPNDVSVILTPPPHTFMFLDLHWEQLKIRDWKQCQAWLSACSPAIATADVMEGEVDRSSHLLFSCQPSLLRANKLNYNAGLYSNEVPR